MFEKHRSVAVQCSHAVCIAPWRNSPRWRWRNGLARDLLLTSFSSIKQVFLIYQAWKHVSFGTPPAFFTIACPNNVQ